MRGATSEFDSLTKTANVIDCILRMYVKAAICSHIELHAGSVGFGSGIACYFNLTGATGNFH